MGAIGASYRHKPLKLWRYLCSSIMPSYGALSNSCRNKWKRCTWLVPLHRAPSLVLFSFSPARAFCSLKVQSTCWKRLQPSRARILHATYVRRIQTSTQVCLPNTVHAASLHFPVWRSHPEDLLKGPPLIRSWRALTRIERWNALFVFCFHH